MTAWIRLAVSRDAEALAELRFAFRAEMRPPEERRDEFVNRCAPWMAARLTNNTAWRCWVSEHDGALIGSLWLSLIEKIPNPGPELEWHGYITSVFVQQDARGRGIAGRLVSAALDYCRTQSVDSVILWPSELSRPLYARQGFSEPRDMMETVLAEGRLPK